MDHVKNLRIMRSKLNWPKIWDAKNLNPCTFYWKSKQISIDGQRARAAPHSANLKLLVSSFMENFLIEIEGEGQNPLQFYYQNVDFRWEGFENKGKDDVDLIKGFLVAGFGG